LKIFHTQVDLIQNFREFFKMELKKMELDNALSGRVKKVGYKWNEYENGTTSELRNALKGLRMSRN